MTSIDIERAYVAHRPVVAPFHDIHCEMIRARRRPPSVDKNAFRQNCWSTGRLILRLHSLVALTSMHGQRWFLVLLLFVSVCRADGFGGEVGIDSDEVFRGLSQSDHQVSPQLDLHYSASGFYGGLSAVGVRRGANDSVGVGLIAYLGYQQRFGDDWSGTISARHYDYPGYGRRSLYDYEEFALSAAWRERIVATVMASPDVFFADFRGYYGRGPAYTYEVSARQPLPLGLSANAGVGYYNLDRQIGTGYAYWSAGLGRQWRSWDFDLRYVGTSTAAKQRFGHFAENRLVASAAWFF